MNFPRQPQDQSDALNHLQNLLSLLSGRVIVCQSKSLNSSHLTSFRMYETHHVVQFFAPLKNHHLSRELLEASTDENAPTTTICVRESPLMNGNPNYNIDIWWSLGKVLSVHTLVDCDTSVELRM